MTVFNEDTMAVESIVADFERSWSIDRADNLETYLPDDLRNDLRHRILWELVEADLELRIKAGISARVEDYLVRFSQLESDHSRVQQFVQSEYRLRSRREPGLDVDEYRRRFPHLEMTLEPAPGSVAPTSTGDGSSHVAPSTSATVEEDLIGHRTSERGRFRLIKPHDEGGLGKVWLAYDEELQREVALKEIREKYADDETSRRRFATEVFVTSGLEHPGIVPVYGFGHYRDGRPYYTMRFVKGISLREAIREYHQQDWGRQPVGSQRVQMQRLLGHFLDVCNTLDYVHQRGVLHRDIKPENIMLGKYGETLVVDWGLAKRIGDPDAARCNDQQAPMLSDSSEFATKLGRALGSPAYMSPEQARGEHDRLGPATDIYSLGATLYTLLTNQAPVKGDRTDDILANVVHSRVPKPRLVNSTIPVALESICLRAMSADSLARYATARELAADIERYLADQPVSCRRESIFEKLSRYTRNHDALVRAGALALITVAVTSFVAALMIDEQRRIAEQAAASESAVRRSALNQRMRADASHARAERYLELLTDAFELTDDNVTGEEITLYEALQNAERRLRGPSAERARMLMELARRYGSIRVYPDALRCARSAVEQLTEQLGPNNGEVLEARGVVADLLEATGELEEAEQIRTFIRGFAAP